MLSVRPVSSDGGGGGIPSWGVGVIVVISLICAGMLALILAMWKYERKGKPLFQPFIMENSLQAPPGAEMKMSLAFSRECDLSAIRAPPTLGY